ncbi:MAG: hypothetical protein RR942_11715 [Romboutsia sp.]
MKYKKYILILNILSILIFTGCSSTRDENYSSNLDVRGLTLKMSLIQTAYEIYNVNIGNPDTFSEDLYKTYGKDSYKHYKWLKSSYSSMNDEIKKSLKNIFTYGSNWEYVGSVINLDDNATSVEIIDTIINDENLKLSGYLKKDIDSFFNYFYDYHFKSYLEKNKYKYNKKSEDINEALKVNDVDIIDFMETTSGIKFNEEIKSIFYYNFNPFQSQEFENDDLLVSTIQPDTTAKDILSIPFHEYSHSLFNTFTSSYEFSEIYSLLEKDKEIIKIYNNIGKDLYTFPEWCEENLVEGFSKYLDYKYYKSAYEYTRYDYDLDFYNYLKESNFNPNKISLKDISIQFYRDKLL